MNQEAMNPNKATPGEAGSVSSTQCEADAIYQQGQIVGRAADVEVDSEAKEIRFGELFNTDLLLLPDECEYQKYRILVQRIAHATNTHPSSPQKGRILRGVIAEIVGYREQ